MDNFAHSENRNIPTFSCVVCWHALAVFYSALMVDSFWWFFHVTLTERIFCWKLELEMALLQIAHKIAPVITAY